LKPLASCLALALALSGTLAAAPVGLITRRPLISDLLPNWRQPVPPPQGVVRNAATAKRYPSLSPIPRRIPEIPAGSIPVTNCDDSGIGSLRDAIDTAVSGQTIDLTATGCSTITLATGDISISQQDLILQGPGASELAIDGNNLYSLRHYNPFGGTLQVHDLTITHGRRYLLATDNLSAKGGCIYSYGTVAMSNAQLSYCTVETANLDPHFFTLGGGVYAKAGLVIENSSITLSSAGTPDLYGYGGAAFTRGPATITHSGLGLNYASGAGGAFMGTGGVFMSYSSIILNSADTEGGLYVAGGYTTIANSTIAQNSATDFGGAFIQGSSSFPATLVNSTISENSATHLVGGLALTRYPAKIANSTIAFNTESNAADATYGAGLFIGTDVEIESSIIARNTLDHSVYGPVGDDIGGFGALTGANNLTQFVLAGLALPADTIYADPRLSSLLYNGGPTLTHALSPLSPAVEAGNNLAGLATDQRGIGFARVIGASPDIGAFELNIDDVLFADDFED
jgi:hypothetical protein